ncbi:MAG: pentapeptide repeat-containing protein [Myxococcales bacterium]|nr:pentapeptide repeat-containing protein [Myxococcales bacterium]MCB9749226.1 pentapeptide repeat-containing protein [Myxococcales bacterium]
MDALTQLLTDEFTPESFARCLEASYTRRGALAELPARAGSLTEAAQRLDRAGLVDETLFTLLDAELVSDDARARLASLRGVWGFDTSAVRSARVQDFWLGVALASHDSGRRDAIIGELRERAGDPKLAYRGHEKDQEQGGEPRLWLRLRATKQGLAKLQELRASGKLKRLRGRAVTSDPIAPPRTVAELARRYKAGERAFPGLTLKGQTIAQLKLDGLIAPGVDLRGATLKGVSLDDADLRDAKLQRARLDDVSLRGASLRNAALGGAVLGDCVIAGACLRGVEMEKVELSRSSLASADLRGVYAPGSRLREVDLTGADLRYVDLERASLESVDLSRADLRTSSFEGARLQAVKLDGADVRGSDVEAAARG